MKMEHCRVGMEVIFGRGNGEQTRGVVEKLNRVKAKVRTTESRGSRSQSGAVWGVPYSMMRPAGVAFLDEVNALPPLNLPVAENPADVPIPWHSFQNGVEQSILEAINIVYSHLSPEFLCCDGELPMSLVNEKRTKLNKQLRSLFQALGREVSEKVALDWSMEKNKNQIERNGTHG
jgi:hypothetical protein